MTLEVRDRFTLSGGTKQDRARALFTGLLPVGDRCFTASEVVKNALPGKELHSLYVSHYKSLDSLARVHGIGDGKIPGPDNVDPGTGRRLPGKKPGTLQPCRWNRRSWLQIISDEIYAWLMEFNQELEALIKQQPPGTRFFCDLETFVISSKVPAEAIPSDLATKPSPPSSGGKGKRTIVRTAGFAAAIFLTLITWPTPRREKPGPSIAVQSTINVAEYLARNRAAPDYTFPSMPEGNFEANWKPTDPFAGELVAMAQPPPIFIAGNR